MDGNANNEGSVPSIQEYKSIIESLQSTLIDAYEGEEEPPGWAKNILAGLHLLDDLFQRTVEAYTRKELKNIYLVL